MEFVDKYNKLNEDIRILKNKLNNTKTAIKIKELTKAQKQLKKELFKTYESKPEQLETDTEGKLKLQKNIVNKKYPVEFITDMIHKQFGDTSATRYIINKLQKGEEKEKIDLVSDIVKVEHKHITDE